MEDKTIFEESDSIVRSGFIRLEEEQALIAKFEEYALTCPEDEKLRCERYIKMHQDRIDYINDVNVLHEQFQTFKSFIDGFHSGNGIELEYVEPFGNSFGVEVKIDNIVMEMVFKPLEVTEKNEVRTKFYLSTSDQQYKQFVLKKECIYSNLVNLKKFRRDYYYLPVGHDNWGTMMIQTIKEVEKATDDIFRMCRVSCPYNADGTSKYSDWKTYANVEISYESDCPLIQGLKNGEQPDGAHVVGGNGSFRVFNKGTYGMKVTVDKMGPEKPVRQEYFFDIDDYLRGIKEKLGRTRMPYKQLNDLLAGKVQVITTDLNLDPLERRFFPVEYDMDWQKFLDDKFGSL